MTRPKLPGDAPHPALTMRGVRSGDALAWDTAFELAEARALDGGVEGALADVRAHAGSDEAVGAQMAIAGHAMRMARLDEDARAIPRCGDEAKRAHALAVSILALLRAVDAEVAE